MQESSSIRCLVDYKANRFVPSHNNTRLKGNLSRLSYKCVQATNYVPFNLFLKNWACPYSIEDGLKSCSPTRDRFGNDPVSLLVPLFTQKKKKIFVRYQNGLHLSDGKLYLVFVCADNRHIKDWIVQCPGVYKRRSFMVVFTNDVQSVVTSTVTGPPSSFHVKPTPKGQKPKSSFARIRLSLSTCLHASSFLRSFVTSIHGRVQLQNKRK